MPVCMIMPVMYGIQMKNQYLCDKIVYYQTKCL